MGNKESKTQPIPSGSSLSVGILGKPKKREVKDEDVSDVVFFVTSGPVTVVVFSASMIGSKLSASAISSSFRVAPISEILVLLLIRSILSRSSFLLTTTFLLSTVLLSF